VHCFTITPQRISGSRITFDREESHHLATVLRLGPGDVVTAIDGRGHAWTVRVETVGDLATGTLVGHAPRQVESPLDITLAQGVAKGDKMEHIVRAATELGVTRVTPVLSERTIVQLEPARWGERARRWQRVAREAAKQCGRTTIPLVETPRELRAFLELDAPADLRLCLWEEASRSHGAGLAASLPIALPPTARVTLLVGPEGGFARHEVAAARERRFVVVGVGPRILRTETAGPAMIAILQARYGDLA